MFDLSSVMEYLKVEPGHGFLQSVLLFMIWIQSKGLRRELADLSSKLLNMKSSFEKRFDQLEVRITTLEKRGA